MPKSRKTIQNFPPEFLSMKLTTLFLLLTVGLWSCAGKPPPSPAVANHINEHGVEIIATPITRGVVQGETLEQQRFSSLLSPYSTEGLMTLNQYRTNNTALNDFLLRNRKPDYFFGGGETDFAFQKIYLVYVESQNLYLFDPTLSTSYKKFNPLPASIQKRVAAQPAQRPVYAAHPTTSPPTAKAAVAKKFTAESLSVDYRVEIEKNLSSRQPQPYLNISLLYDIPTEKNPDGSVPTYPDLYFLDKPLEELVENAYSIKYESTKHRLKIIFPQAYEAGDLYQNDKMEARKILVSQDTSNGRELSLVVPDFLPGSAFYQSTRGNMAKAFASLYQVNLPRDVNGQKNLRMRYQIKLCQNDTREQCAVRKGNVMTVRAIVMAATLYDSTTLKPIETFVLK